MICKEYNCVFVHIPKAAGQSVEHFFLNLLGLTWEQRDAFVMRYNDDPALGPERLAHLTAEEYITCGHMSPADYAGSYKFSFVRNPWARLVSEYKFRNKTKQMTFKEFVARGMPKPGRSDEYRHVIPQYDFLYSRSGELLVDFVGRFETLQSDFDRICDHLGIKDTTLPHVNSSKKAANPLKRLFTRGSTPAKDHYSAYYDSETKDRVSKFYAKDIEAFSYSFGE